MDPQKHPLSAALVAEPPVETQPQVSGSEENGSAQNTDKRWADARDASACLVSAVIEQAARTQLKEHQPQKCQDSNYNPFSLALLYSMLLLCLHEAVLNVLQPDIKVGQ